MPKENSCFPEKLLLHSNNQIKNGSVKPGNFKRGAGEGVVASKSQPEDHVL